MFRTKSVRFRFLTVTLKYKIALKMLIKNLG